MPRWPGASCYLKSFRGADPENFDLSKDGKQLYTSNEDISSLSIVDLATATVVKTIKMGGQPEGVRNSPKWEMCLRYVHHGIRPCNGASDFQLQSRASSSFDRIYS